MVEYIDRQQILTQIRTSYKWVYKVMSDKCWDGFITTRYRIGRITRITRITRISLQDIATKRAYPHTWQAITKSISSHHFYFMRWLQDKKLSSTQPNSAQCCDQKKLTIFHCTICLLCPRILPIILYDKSYLDLDLDLGLMNRTTSRHVISYYSLDFLASSQ